MSLEITDFRKMRSAMSARIKLASLLMSLIKNVCPFVNFNRNFLLKLVRRILSDTT